MKIVRIKIKQSGLHSIYFQTIKQLPQRIQASLN